MTDGFTPDEKFKFLKKIGYNSFKDIEKLTPEQLEDLLTFLMKDKKKLETVEISGVKVTRPEKPRSIKDISFTIK